MEVSISSTSKIIYSKLDRICISFKNAVPFYHNISIFESIFLRSNTVLLARAGLVMCAAPDTTW